MKLLIVQLSDMHCKETDGKLTKKIEKAVNAIKTIGKVDRVVLVFSGDLVDGSTVEEYRVGRHMIGKFLSDLSKALRCGTIITQIVPGNHDMFLPKDCRDAALIETWDKEEHLQEELDRMHNFFDYAKGKKCFEEDQLCDVSVFEFGTTKVQICKLNSAPFSTRKPDDKQFHYFPSYVAEKLNRASDVDLKITVMHHHYEWCEWDTKEMIKKAIASDDITFFGHDHKAETFTTQYANGRTNNIFMGGRFDLDPSCNAAFNAVVFDDETKLIDRYEFAWSVEDELFVPKTCGTITVKTNKLVPLQEYLDRLLEDNQGIGESLLE